MQVLLIEPDRILARQYQKAFEAVGFKVQVCSGAQQAVTIIDKQPPDVIIIELQLSGHSGVEFLHEFRSYEDWVNIPVIIYSSVPEYALGVGPSAWRSLGVSRYFYKPQTSLNQLVGAVKGLLA
jgi:DNA-binding response OmpR family regulator